MIAISNSPLDVLSIKKDYPQNSLQSALLTSLDQESEKMNYESTNELKFELDLRAALVTSAIKLNESKLNFAVFRKSKCNNQYWKRLPNGGFLLLQNAKPSAGILDIYNNGYRYATECATAMVIVLYRALLSVFNETAFNRAFPNIYLMNWHDLSPKIADIGHLRPTSYHLPGDRRYFVNPDVSPKTPEWQGENTIQLTQNTYYGHGIGITSTNKILSQLNEARKENATKLAFLREDAGRPNFKYLYQLKTNL